MAGLEKYEVIVIGGSWGGLEAILTILNELPPAYPLTIIIVLHRLKNVKSDLVEVLEKRLKRQVKEIEDKEPIEKGMIYLVPANYHVLIEDDKSFSINYSELVNYSRPSIDVLFESASDVFSKKLIGIILTGANADGSEGLKKIKQKGGFVIIQEPDDAECPVMPVAALKKIKADKILTRVEINNYLKNLSSNADYS